MDDFARAGFLEEMTMEDVAAFHPEVVVLPLGSTEPHGPALPFGTDTWQVTEVCRAAVRRANGRGARVLLYPALPITNNANFRRFPFSLRIGVRTLMSVIVDVVTQCRDDGVRKVVIVNGHGGNPGAIAAAMREIAGMDGMPFVAAVPPEYVPAGFTSPVSHPSDHAGEDEASRMLHLRPELVRKDRLADNPVGRLRVPLLEGVQFVRPWHLYVPRAAGGDSREATAEKGRIVLEAGAEALAALLIELSAAPWDDRFPYV